MRFSQLITCLRQTFYFLLSLLLGVCNLSSEPCLLFFFFFIVGTFDLSKVLFVAEHCFVPEFCLHKGG
jgi:hypothetical protein